MKLKRLLVIILIILMVIAIVATLFGSNSSTNPLEPKENVSIAVTGDVMFARKMPNVLSLDSSPFAVSVM